MLKLADKHDFGSSYLPMNAIARALHIPPKNVFRSAGLLPTIPEERSQMKEHNYLLNMLDDDNLQELLENTKLRLEKQEAKQEKKQTRRSASPARNALKEK